LRLSDITGSAISSNDVTCLRRNKKRLLYGGVALVLFISFILAIWYVNYSNNKKVIDITEIIKYQNHTIDVEHVSNDDENVTYIEKPSWEVRFQYSNGTYTTYGCTGFLISGKC
jgi:spore maturation protein CgeB